MMQPMAEGEATMNRGKTAILKPGIVTVLQILLILINMFFNRTDSSAAPFAYITNHGSNTVSVIDTATNTVVGTPITVGSGPFGVAVNPTGSHVYVTNVNAHTVSVIETDTNTVVETIPVGYYPRGIAVNPSGSRVYVANSDDNNYLPVDIVSVIDTATSTVIDTIEVGNIPFGVAINSSGSLVYVTNDGTDNISVIDTASNTVIDTIAVGRVPVGIAINPSDSHLYVAHYHSTAYFSAIDTATQSVVGSLLGPPAPATSGYVYGLAVHPMGSHVYVANAAANNVSVIETANNTFVGTPIAVGEYAFGIAINPSGSHVYVANHSDASVSVIETATNTVVGTPIPVGNLPVAIGKFIGPPECAPPSAGAPFWAVSGLVSWWGADNNLLDMMGTNNGTYVGVETYAQGSVGKAFSFDGSSQYVQVTSPAALPVGSAARTVMLWFKTPSSLSGDSALIQYGTASDSNMFGLIFSSNDTGKLYFYGHNADLSGTTSIQPDTWYHGAVTYDSSVVRLYINGNEEASAPIVLNTVLDINGLTIGYRVGGAKWQGLIDEPAIFNRALAVDEIAAIYNAGSAGKCRSCSMPPSGMASWTASGLISWWGGNNNTLDTVSGNSGTFIGNGLYAPGRVGSAFSFDGVSDYVLMNLISTVTDNLSMSAWVKWGGPNASNSFQRIFYNGDSGPDGYGIYLASLNQNGVPDGTLTILVGGHTFTYTGSQLAQGAWHHVAAVRNSGTWTCYLDGIALSVDNNNTAPNTPTGSASIGGSSYGNDMFKGLIDEVQFFNRALSPDKIALIANRGGIANCSVPMIKRKPSNTFHERFSDAFTGIQDSDSILVREGTLTENPDFSSAGNSISLQGGCNADFVTDPLKYSTINGSLTITNGGISIENIVVR
ncbi:MAG: hypothetical protein C0402_06850 [Thermodesulfovibrio sp.]|nr:hypothetical protein [Thermodesulfovibrio sp.]